MPEKQQASVQRSFRLSARTIELLDAAAAAGGESRNALADRLLGEAVRLERHPLIRFHQGAAGRRQPLIVGTRLYIHQVMSTLRAGRGDIDEAAAHLGIAPRLVRAAVEYYAEFAALMRWMKTRPWPRASREMSGPAGNASGALWREVGPRPALLDRDRHKASRAGLRCLVAIERGWETEDDEALLVLCDKERRALVTNNVADFIVIARGWAIEVADIRA